jgi:hypothetical protein
LLLSTATRPSLDIFWFSDESLDEPDNFSDPDMLAQEIVD